MEHALAEKGAGQADPIKPADERIGVIDLDRVTMPALEQGAIELADSGVDPGPAAAGLGLGAAIDDGVEIAVAHDAKAPAAQRAGEPRRHVEALERQDAPALGLDPIERRVLGALGHREDAAGIGLEQHLGRDLDLRALSVGHF